MKRLIGLLVTAGLPRLVTPAAAQPSYPPGVPTVVYGQVIKIDGAANVVSIRQVMPKNVGMEPITTTFGITDKALLSRIHEGDKVKAVTENVNGQPTVLKICRRPWPIQ